MLQSVLASFSTKVSGTQRMSAIFTHNNAWSRNTAEIADVLPEHSILQNFCGLRGGDHCACVVLPKSYQNRAQ
jgi:hypothetical protein